MIIFAPRVRGRLFVLSALLAAVLVPAPAAAGDATATLTVRAQVVENCRIRLPEPVPWHVRSRLPDPIDDLVDHRCQRPVQPRITAGRRDVRPSAVTLDRHPARSTVLITLTY